jgi:methionine sulfoxide reductase heme-binding subunit
MTNWILLRAAGVAAYVMLFLSVAWGLVGTTSVVGKRMAKATAVAIHQFISTVALVLLGVHLTGLAFDRFVPFRPLDILVPQHSTYRPFAVTLGIVAMYAAVVVLVSSWMRKHLSTKLWRGIHLLAVPAFTLAMLHGVFSGTDTVRPWMWWTYAATGSTVVFLLLVRAFTAGAAQRRSAERARQGAQVRPAPAASSPRPAEPAATRPPPDPDRVAAARARAAALRAGRTPEAPRSAAPEATSSIPGD